MADAWFDSFKVSPEQYEAYRELHVNLLLGIDICVIFAWSADVSLFGTSGYISYEETSGIKQRARSNVTPSR